MVLPADPSLLPAMLRRMSTGGAEDATAISIDSHGDASPLTRGIAVQWIPATGRVSTAAKHL